VLGPRASWSAASLPATPTCGDHDDPTPPQTAGPYYRPASPLRSDLRTEFGRGEPMDLSGRVLDTRCSPLSGVIVEIWHADDAGTYDNRGFRLRGHQRTDSQGRWAFQTILTRHYAIRTAHYHFRVQASGRRALVTQLYFPDHPRNTGDSIFNPRLLMRLGRDGERQTGYFDFVLPA
jgi:protocatechuate 3,4-dioxygenase beta subunit